MPEIGRLFAAEAVAFFGSLFVALIGYFTRRRKDPAQSKRGALAWALIDTYETFVGLAVITFAIFVGLSGNAYQFVGAILLGGCTSAFIMMRTKDSFARFVIRKLGA